MNSTLEQQLAIYGRHLATLAPPVSEPEIETRPPKAPRRPLLPRLAIAVAAAAVVLFTIGILAVLLPLRGDEAAPPDTAPTTTLPAPTTTLVGTDAVSGPVNDVRDVAFASDGSLWAATRGGVVRWDLTTRTSVVFVEQDGLPSRNVQEVAAGPDSVWVAGDNWVAGFDGSWTAFTWQQVPKLEDVENLAVGPDGTVWMAVGSGELLSFDGVDWTSATPPQKSASLAVGPDGTVWASTYEPGGIFAYDGTWHRYGRADGLPFLVSNLAVAADGTVWVGGAGADPVGDIPSVGIARLDGTTWTAFTTADGLVANAAAVAVGPDGTLWAVNTEGIARFDGTTWTSYPDLGGGGLGAAVATDGTLWMPSAAGIIGFDGSDTTYLVVEAEATSAPERVPAITLTPAPDVDPIRVSTVLGDLEFTTLQFPTDDELTSLVVTPSSLVATPDGLVAIDDHVLRWSTDGLIWEGVPSPVSGGLIVEGADVVVLGDKGAVRYGWDGRAWSEKARLDLPGPMDQIVFGPRGAVALRGSTIHYSPDGVHFSEAESGPSRNVLVAAENVPEEDRDFGDCRATFGATVSQIRAVLATDAGFVALTSASHPDDLVCAPFLWFSVDGNTWDLVSSDSPFGKMAIVYADDFRGITEHDGRFVASGRVGGQGLTEESATLWVSDDGLAWQQADVDIDDAFEVAVGDLGWIMLTGEEMWFSADGFAWDGPHDQPDGLGTGWFMPQLAVGSDTIFGVGTVSGTWDFTAVVGRLQE